MPILTLPQAAQPSSSSTSGTGGPTERVKRPYTFAHAAQVRVPAGSYTGSCMRSSHLDALAAHPAQPPPNLHVSMLQADWDHDLTLNGTWVEGGDGSRTWQLCLDAPGAHSLTLSFR